MISAEQKDKWDNLSTHDCAIKTGISIGIAKGFAKGRLEGLEKGREEGRTEGRAEGERNASIRIAKAFLSKGVPLNIVEASTGLSAVELQKLM